MRRDLIGAVPLGLVVGFQLCIAALAADVAASPWTSIELPPEAERLYSPMDASRTGLYVAFERAGLEPVGLWKYDFFNPGWTQIGLVECDPASIRTTGWYQEMVLVSCRNGDIYFYVSPDDGETWIPKDALTKPLWLGADRHEPCTIYGMACMGSIFRSTDLGDTWDEFVWCDGCSDCWWWGIEPLPWNCMEAYALRSSGGFYTRLLRTTDGGLTWSFDPDFPPSENDQWGELAVSVAHPDAVFVTTVDRLAENAQGTWRTHDLPASTYWKLCEIPLWAPETIYIAGIEYSTGDLRAAKSEDFGESWIDISDGLPDTEIYLGEILRFAWAPNAGRIYLSVGAPAMLFEREEPMPMGIQESFAGARSAKAIWPNPSTAGSRIRIQGLPPCRSGHGPSDLQIVDISGRKVRMLDPSDSGGNRTCLYEWDGRDGNGNLAPAGVYFARFEGDGSPGGKIFLIR